MGCGSSSGETNSNGVSFCGNLQVDPGEECDHGPLNSDLAPDACRSSCTLARCGDGVIDTGEVCDSFNVGSESCTSQGFDGGALSCSVTCTLDTSSCFRCGDGTVDAGEECDGDVLDGETCESLGYPGGTLACAGCAFDLSGCSVCGNGVVEAGEVCDDGNTVDDLDCSADCQRLCGDGTLDADLGEACDDGASNGVSPHPCRADCQHNVCGDGYLGGGEQCDAGPANSDSQPDACRTDCLAAHCGDGVMDGGEACDGLDLGIASCVDFGYATPIGLACTGGCELDPGACQAICGNGVLEPGEQCDGSLLGAWTCLDFGYSQSGGLGCDGACVPDTAGCTPTCGDGVVEPGEVCDDGNTVGGDGCRADCLQDMTLCGNGTVDPGEACDNGAANSDTMPDACRTNCAAAWCGDGVNDSGEACDDGAANSDTIPDACRTTCAAAGCGDGVLDAGEACDDGATNSDTAPDACRTTCVTATCGDGAVDSGEACDDGNSSQTDGCLNDCTANVCGDGHLNAGVEQCEGSQLGGQDCVSQGFDGGSLGCQTNCTFDTSSCVVCGNGYVDGTDQCDGADLAGESCMTKGFDSGSLGCYASCTFDTSGCGVCGNGIVDGDNACDGADLAGESCATQGWVTGTLACTASCQLDDSGCSGNNTGLTCVDAYDLTGATAPVTLPGQHTGDYPRTCNSDTVYNAVYFTYTAAVDGWHRVHVTNQWPWTYETTLSIHETHACNPAGPTVLCGHLYLTDVKWDMEMTAGTTYLIEMGTYDDIRPMQAPTGFVAPIVFGPGEDCAHAHDVTSETFPYTLTGGDFSYATDLGSLCGGWNSNAAWFQYTSSVTDWYDVTLTNNAVGGDDSRMRVYETAACDPRGAEVGYNWSNNATVSQPVRMEAGQTYTILLCNNGDTPLADPQIDISARTFLPGEICETAVDVTGSTTPTSLSGTFEYELDPFASCSGVARNGVWFRYTAQSSGPHDLILDNTAGPAGFTYLAVFEGGDCYNRGPEILCQSESSRNDVVVDLVAGQEYLILFHKNSNSYPIGNPEITLHPTVYGPGERCSEAVDISAEAMPYQLLGSFWHNPDPPPSCNPLAYDQVWFTYTPTTTGWHEIGGSGSELAVFEGGDCASYGLELTCRWSSLGAPTIQYLTSGVTYYLMTSSTSLNWPIEDPMISVVPSGPPMDGEHCGYPAVIGSGNHSVNWQGHDCWTWLQDSANIYNENVFCGWGGGGDAVVAYTTGSSQTTLSFDITFSITGVPQVEILEGDCRSGTSIYCDDTWSSTSHSDTVIVSPDTTYYLWFTDVYFSDNPLRDTTFCIY